MSKSISKNVLRIWSPSIIAWSTVDRTGITKHACKWREKVYRCLGIIALICVGLWRVQIIVLSSLDRIRKVEVPIVCRVNADSEA